MKKCNVLMFYFSIILVLFLSFSCGKQKMKTALSAEERMANAIKKFEKGDYLDVKTEFKIILLNYPGSTLSDKAQYYLAECHFNLKEYILATAEYEKLIRVYPNSEYSDDAQYKVALSYFKLSPKYSLDQENTKKAIAEFQRFLEDYPKSDLVPEANKMMLKCREKLAQKNYKSGEIYKKRALFRAAIIYFDHVLDTYYDTKYAKSALYDKAECYRKLDEYEQALKFYQLYLEKYPKAANLEKVKKEITDIQEHKLSTNN